MTKKPQVAIGALAGTLVLGSAFAMQPLANPYANGDEKPGHHTLKDMDTNGDGKLSKAEFAKAHGGKTDEFAAHDLNKDGFITQTEMDKHHAAMKKAKTDSGEGTCGSGAATTDKSKTEGKCGAGKCGAGKCGSSL